MKNNQSNTKVARIVRAITLHGAWQLRWFHTVFVLWPMLLAAAWGASPYFMVYVVGMPEPGTAPRYVGTIRFEGELQRTKSGWTPPKYFIQTSKGEVEFHCRYRPAKGECWFTTVLGVKPEPDDVYEIGYDPYWGLDYIKYPDRLSKLNDYGEAKNITTGRIGLLYAHERSVLWFCFLFLTYLYLIWLAYHKSDPDQQSDASTELTPSQLMYHFPPTTTDVTTKGSQPKRRRSFFD